MVRNVFELLHHDFTDGVRLVAKRGHVIEVGCAILVRPKRPNVAQSSVLSSDYGDSGSVSTNARVDQLLAVIEMN